MAIRKLLEFDAVPGTFDSAAQVLGQRVGGDPFAFPHRDGFWR